MGLCVTCNGIDFRSLFISCLQQYQDRQEFYYGDGEDTSSPDNSSYIKQHDDIFELEKWAGSCDLCGVILQAFKKRNVANKEDTRGLPIGFRPFQNKIEVCYNSNEGPIKLCGLDLYMSSADGIYSYRDILGSTTDIVYSC